jgi:cation diffusion facilitator CzcD-associated flavoprotein CzcO
MTDQHDVVVIGAGMAGVATALSLAKRGVKPLVLEAGETAGAAWHTRYDRLRLNSPRETSHLPGRRYPKGTPRFPAREAVAAHIADGAAGLDVRTQTEVTRVDPDDGAWRVDTASDSVGGRQVVVATGNERQPDIPDWPGRDEFRGELIHAAEYLRPDAYAGRQVLVVGPGCSGMEIAYDIAEGGAAKVWLAARTPPNIVLRTGPGGLPADHIANVALHLPTKWGDAMANFGRRMDLGDLSEFGLPVPEVGVMTRHKQRGLAPAIVDKPVIEAIKEGRVEVTRGVERLDATGVVLADGARIEPDAVIAATGYRRGLEPLVGHLGVLDAEGRPRSRGEEAAAPGLRFIGFVPRPGQLGGMVKEAKRAARAIARELG